MSIDYFKSQFFRLQLGLQALFLALAWALPKAIKEPVFEGIALVLLILIGIPHGANDLLYRPDKTQKGALIFLSLYLGSMILYGLLWWIVPILALLIFLVISVHHFGQSNFENKNWNFPPSLLWGSWLLVAPILIHYQESTQIFGQMMAWKISTQYSGISALLLRYSLLSLYLVFIWKKFTESKIELVIQGIMIALWYESSSLLSGFIIVFALWHSSQSLYYQWKYYQKQESATKPSLAFFGLNMFLFTLIAATFLYALSHFLELNIAMLFILLSIITLPHVVVMDGIYQKK